MACSHTRGDVSRLVLEVLSGIHEDQVVVEASEFGPQGINADAEFRSTYFSPIRAAVETDDCRLKKFSPADCEQAETVRDIVDAVWKDFKPTTPGAVKAPRGARTLRPALGGTRAAAKKEGAKKAGAKQSGKKRAGKKQSGKKQSGKAGSGKKQSARKGSGKKGSRDKESR